MLRELTRFRAEYLDMLKREQVRELCSLERTVCERVLNTMVETRFLYLKAKDTFTRFTECANGPRPAPSNATIAADHRSPKAS
jgi:hypothetical protein